MPRDVGVVLVAAGQGLRAGGGEPKQFRPIAGVPMLLRALRPFTAHPDVAQVVVDLPADIAAAPPTWLAELGGGMLTCVAGGAERTDSVRNGLAALRSECHLVLVHDGARPFIERGLIDRVVARARGGAGAVPALMVSDTLKKVTGTSAEVAETVSRDGLYRAQTPQAFPVAMLRKAFDAPTTPGYLPTDEASLVEATNSGVVVLVEGSALNLKITTPDDFVLAEAIAAKGGS
ncbi:MAG: 2-C-methyl-D-erythritol 4-phosphate cytidylyltransferase [Gemmatimonadetes bacterium]|nr:2-C-methyl-D-erythritol 4-phosphate cytidylyltransferase [Gemmatimonadota bacterium]